MFFRSLLPFNIPTGWQSFGILAGDISNVERYLGGGSESRCFDACLALFVSIQSLPDLLSLLMQRTSLHALNDPCNEDDNS